MFGIAFTHLGSPDGRITGWLKDEEGKIELYPDRDSALKANDRDGWRGYVKEYTGEPDSIIPQLISRLRAIRVLRSSCADSFDGAFRVHLPEGEWNEIEELVRKYKEEK